MVDAPLPSQQWGGRFGEYPQGQRPQFRPLSCAPRGPMAGGTETGLLPDLRRHRELRGAPLFPSRGYSLLLEGPSPQRTCPLPAGSLATPARPGHRHRAGHLPGGLVASQVSGSTLLLLELS